MWTVATSNSASETVSSPPNPRSHLKVKFATLVEEGGEAGGKEGNEEAEPPPADRREDHPPFPSDHEDYGDLPDGSCFRRGKFVCNLSSNPANSNARAAIIRSAEYMGSFAVAGTDQATRAEYIRNQLQQMRGCLRTKPVLLIISLAGIKVCSVDGKSVHMAHALRRISYATCDPEHLQFSFLAREPRGHLSLQYCHSFLAQSSQQAEELNSIVGNAFRMAYASQLHRRAAPSTSSSSNSSVCSSSSTPPPPPPPLPDTAPRAFHPTEKRRNQLNQDKHGSQQGQHSVNDNNNNSNNNQQQQLSLLSSSNHRRISEEVCRVVGWQTKQHPQPISPTTEMNVRISGSQSLESQSPIGSGPVKPNSIPGLGTKSDPPKRVIGTSEVELDKENGLHLRTMESSPSSDESNSPTEMNSYKRMTEKPPLIKRLAMMGVGSGFSPRGDESCPLVRQATSPTPPTSQSSPAGNSESPTKIPQVNSPMDMTQFKSQMKHRPMSGGYVNEAATSTDGDVVGSGTSSSTGPAKASTDSKQVTITKHIETDSKRPLQEPSPTCDDLKSKRISHVSSSSSSVPGITAPASTSSTASPVRNVGLSMTYTQQNEQTLRLTSQAAAGGATSFMGCCTPPPLPERSDSLNDRSAEEGELRAAPWFQAGIPREITLEVLGQEPVGAFMVRESTSKPGCYALSLRVPRDFQQSGIAHYLIMRTNKGYKIKGFTKEFSTLTSLIIHHSVMPELLPCPLSLSRYNPSFINSDSNRDFADIDSDPDYNTLADFRKMMADLNV